MLAVETVVAQLEVWLSVLYRGNATKEHKVGDFTCASKLVTMSLSR